MNLSGHSGDTEICDPHVSGPIDHDIARLQIPMKDSLFVRRSQAAAQPACYLQGLVGWDASDAAQK
jgi:hypothetical protein